MDKIEIMILVFLMAVVAGAYSVHWLFGLGLSFVIAAAIGDHSTGKNVKGFNHAKHN
ncbi:hypothetical protein phiA034_gene0054 [Aeromonas phage phiA034]|uniref:Uncharacterized protein n=1 Tax=Aeromonas phage phiA034 TaxID=2985287 RepID=A0AAE9YHA2_9CAUD|nr:hypothetical protein pAEv1812_65 [Aeromonas phage pAEv1812]WCZ66137.1 hypothetical protein phiA034_gene0054 [Aeromonas phage phiA034]